MGPRGLMWLGAYSGAMMAAISVVGTLDSVVLVFVSFSGGMVFGKGYGIWEERSRREAAK